GSVTFSITSLADFMTRAKSPGRGFTAAETEAAVGGILGPAIDQTLAAHDAREFDGPSKLIEDSIRLSAGPAGLRVSSVQLDPVGRMSPTDQLAAMQRRAQASRTSPPAPPALGTVSGTPAAPPSGAVVQICPSCQASNPASVRFCGNCGKPLPTKRACPRCGTEAAPGVK